MIEFNPQEFQLLKGTLLDYSGLDKDALHIYAGLATFIVVRLCWRWTGGWALAWLSALAVALAAEWLDIRALNTSGPIQPDANHWHDVWNTMFWPTVLLFFGRWLHPSPSRPTDDADGSGDFLDQPLEQAPAV